MSTAPFLHDSNRRNQDAVLGLRAVRGWAGYGLNQALREMMRETPGYRLTLARTAVYAGHLGVQLDELNTLIEDCLRLGLFEQDGTFFWCPDLLEKMLRYHARIEKLSSAGKKGAQARLDNLQAKLKPPLPGGEALPPSPNGVDGDFSSLDNKINSTYVQEVPTEVHQEQVTPHPYGKFLNPDISDISTGRRPMLEYPHIWIHPCELEDAKKRWDRAGFDREEFREALRTTNVAMEQKQHAAVYRAGKAYEYLCGHVLTNALAQKKELVSVAQRTGEPLKKPAPRKPQAQRSQQVSPNATITEKAPEKTLLPAIGEILKGVS